MRDKKFPDEASAWVADGWRPKWILCVKCLESTPPMETYYDIQRILEEGSEHVEHSN